MHYGKVTFLIIIVVVLVRLVLIFISTGIKSLEFNLPETVGTQLLHKILLNINVELDQNSSG